MTAARTWGREILVPMKKICEYKEVSQVHAPFLPPDPARHPPEKDGEGKELHYLLRKNKGTKQNRHLSSTCNGIVAWLLRWMAQPSRQLGWRAFENPEHGLQDRCTHWMIAKEPKNNFYISYFQKFFSGLGQLSIPIVFTLLWAFISIDLTNTLWIFVPTTELLLCIWKGEL